MYYAQNPTDESAALAFFSAQFASEPELRWMAVIDGAFDYAAAGVAPSFSGGLNCYESNTEELDDLAPAAPWLIALRPDASGLERLAALITHCSGRPMLSVLATPVFADELIAYWQPLHWLHMKDKQRFLLRFFDTRVVAVLPEVLTARQWAAIAAPLAHWFYIDRDGAVKSAPPVAPATTRAPMLEMSQKQIDALMDFSAPDAAIDFLSDYSAELIPKEMLPSRFHRHITAVFELARKHHIESWPDQVGLVNAECITRGAFRAPARLPALEHLLRSKSWTAGGLEELLVDNSFC